MNEDFLRRFLPSYLWPGQREELVRQLRSSSDSPNPFYSTTKADDDIAFQGDGFMQFNFVNLLTDQRKVGHAMIISNTCDVAIENTRNLPINLMYAPIHPLNGFEQMLSKAQPDRATSVLAAIRKNQYTHILYLPEFPGTIPESIVRFDMIHNIAPGYLYDDAEWKMRRLFTLSMFGFYTTIIKLSVHFHRVHEGVDRDTSLN